MVHERSYGDSAMARGSRQVELLVGRFQPQAKREGASSSVDSVTLPSSRRWRDSFPDLGLRKLSTQDEGEGGVSADFPGQWEVGGPS